MFDWLQERLAMLLGIWTSEERQKGEETEKSYKESEQFSSRKEQFIKDIKDRNDDKKEPK